MVKRNKMLLGVVTFWALLQFIATFILVCVDVLAGFPSLPPPEQETPWWIMPGVIATTVFLMVGLQLYYVAYLVKHPRMPYERKAAWIACVIAGGVFTMLPLYITEVVGRDSGAETS